MNDKLNFFLRTVLSATVEDREAFIRKFSRILEEYAGIDPEQGVRTGQHMIRGLTAIRDELQVEALRKKDIPDKEREASCSEKDEIRNALQKIQAEIDAVKSRIGSEDGQP